MDKTNNNSPIYENDNYKVVVGDSLIFERPTPVYLCINNGTGIIEAEEQMLPRIIDYALQLDEKVKEMEEEGILPTEDTIVEDVVVTH